MKDARIIVANVAKIPDHLVVEVMHLAFLRSAIHLDVLVDDFREWCTPVGLVCIYTAHWCPRLTPCPSLG